MAQEPVKVAVFDLNQTVYRKSSKDEFFKFICYKKNYKLLNILQLSVYGLMKKLKLINKTKFKENFFKYLDGLPPEQVHKYARQFWEVEWDDHFNEPLLQRIKELRAQGVQIIFITGGFDVYVAPLFEKQLQADAWMATQTRYEKGTYKIKGKALKDEEKVRRLNEHFAGRPYKLIETYSDQEEALFELAEKAYLMKNGKPVLYQPD
ncbi:HAD family phosphatase [Cesiribacter sp. SM1]|uniref:HAD family hydrolase n=1 Tax=Cesiribacter sp. SM1 TaxID=2861196 RepID=UPI001CD61602|nr:haloacid dehalogenase-like hydrolase [Cesiribacter sp. SM1]